MRVNTVHAIRNELQCILSFIELGFPEKAIKCIHDADKILGKPRTPWTGGRYEFQLDREFMMAMEIMPEKVLFLEVWKNDLRVRLAIQLDVARSLGELFLSFADLADLRESNPAIPFIPSKTG